MVRIEHDAVGNLGVVNWHADTKFDNASAKTGMRLRSRFKHLQRFRSNHGTMSSPKAYWVWNFQPSAEIEFYGREAAHRVQRNVLR